MWILSSEDVSMVDVIVLEPPEAEASLDTDLLVFWHANIKHVMAIRAVERIIFLIVVCACLFSDRRAVFSECVYIILKIPSSTSSGIENLKAGIAYPSSRIVSTNSQIYIGAQFKGNFSRPKKQWIKAFTFGSECLTDIFKTSAIFSQSSFFYF